MIDVVFPRKSRDLFSGRAYFLGQLNKNSERGKNTILLGQKYIGKSTILKEFIVKAKDVNSIYVDFEKISKSPEKFAVEFIGNICFWFLGKRYKEYSGFMEIETLKKLELKSSGAAAIINDVENELSKIKPDQNLLINKAFSFPQVLSKESGKRIVVCVKEFQEIFSLENYEGIKDVLAIFNECKGNCVYLATSSEINSVKERLSKCFDIEEVGYMSKDETGELLGKAGKKADINQVYKLAKGHPLYSLAIADGDAERKFISEALVKKGAIYNSCRDIFYSSLNRARGKTLLTITLKILAKEDGLRLSEISRRLYRASPVTKNLLARLIDVDLIRLENKRFSISDPILRYWIRNVFDGLEFDHDIDEKILGELAKEL